MPTTSTLLVFTAAALALIVIPGPNVLFILARGINDGRRVAIWTTFGVETATLVFVFATAAGLAAVLASSAVAFATLRYLGAAYLVYLGVRALLARRGLYLDERRGTTSDWSAYRQGFLVGIANPKVALFFVALFPQFVDPERGSVAVQVLILGAIFTVLGQVSDTMMALASSGIGAWLRRRPAVAGRTHYLAGATYLALGASAALVGGRPSQR